MRRSFNFRRQMSVGAMGVQLAKTILRARFTEIVDYEKDLEMQRRGIDLYVEGLGYIEVKTDTHKPEAFFFELNVENRPGAVDRSCADYFCIIFPEYRVMYLIPRPELQQWLRNNIYWIEEEERNWIKKIESDQGRNHWRATGVVVPRTLLMADIEIAIISWNEEEEVINAGWGA